MITDFSSKSRFRVRGSFAAVLALATLAVAVPAATAQPSINRNARETHIGQLQFTFHSLPSCGDDTVLTTVYTAELDFHEVFLIQPNGGVNFVETGSFEAVPSDPTLPTFTGEYSLHIWGTNEWQRDVRFVVAREADGSIRTGRLTRIYENVNGTWVLASEELSQVQCP